MKKPQVFIGLLAALGTAIGVLVAVIGLPYGRADYSAFAESYHAQSEPGVHMSVDSDISNGISPTDANRNVLLGTLSVAVDVTAGNTAGPAFILGTFNFDLVHLDDSRLIAPSVAGTMDSNPDFTADTGAGLPDWACGPPNPDNDTNALVGDPGQRSFISCFNGVGTGPTVPSGAVHSPLARVTYDIPGGALAGAVPVVIENSSIFDDTFTQLMSCSGPKLPGEPCDDGQITLVEPPPATYTHTPTNTTIPPTATETSVPPAGSVVDKICADGVALPNGMACNLWICEDDGVPGDECLGEGEGELRVVERATNVYADYDNDNIKDEDEPALICLGVGPDFVIGTPDDTPPCVDLAEVQNLGAYEFSVEYDNFVIQSLNPCDLVFGADATAVDEVNSSTPANGDCTPDSGTLLPASCAFSLVLESIVHFGCVSTNPAPGGDGPIDLASLVLIPHPDLNNDLFPGNNNGVLTVIKDNGCELADGLGHPTLGDVGGGLTNACRDLAVTVRILEGDIDLDCDVDLTDAQAIAGHYGAFFGGLLYSKWLDLEPQFHDLDIDIKDIQKVFGRQDSTCQDPIPDQPPLPPFTPFGD